MAGSRLKLGHVSAVAASVLFTIFTQYFFGLSPVWNQNCIETQDSPHAILERARLDAQQRQQAPPPANDEYWKIVSSTGNEQLQAKEAFFMQMIEQYKQLHDAAMNGSIPLDKVRFTRCGHNAGWGNRFQHLVSCVLYCIVSGRVALAHPRNKGYFLQFWDDYFLDTPIQMIKFNSTMLDGLEAQEFYANPDTIVCEDLTKLWANVHVLDLNPPGWYDYWGTSIVYNVHHQLLHKVPPNWFGILMRYLFRLNPRMQQDVDDFKRQHFGNYTIGIQARTWTPNVANGNAKRNPVIPMDVYIQAAELLAVESGLPWPDVRLFVVTPNVSYVERAQQAWGVDRVVFVAGEVSEHSRNGTRNGLLNYWLMGECDDLVVTEISSYGTNAAARADKVPVTCTSDRICFRRLTPEPCQDSPYPIKESYCKDKSPIHPYVPGVQSTCAYFSYQRAHKRWVDHYDSWAWTRT